MIKKKYNKEREIKERVLLEATLYLNSYMTIRDVGKIVNVSKSTVGYDLKNRLLKYDLYLYKKVKDKRERKKARN